jgi:hypothetical protein
MSLLRSVASWYGRVVQANAPVLTLAIPTENFFEFVCRVAKSVRSHGTVVSRRTDGR